MGTVGLGIISQIFNINNFVMQFGLIGLPMGLVRYISQFEKENEWEKIYNLLKTVLIVLLSFSILISLLTIIYADHLSELLLNSKDYRFLIILTGLSFPFSFIYMTFESYLRGLKKFNDYVNIAVSVIISGLIVAIILVYYYNIEGVAFGIFLSSVVGLLLYVLYFIKKKLVDFKRIYTAKIDFRLFKRILSIGVGSLIIGVMAQLSIIIVRTEIIKNLGVEANGIYQAVYGISNNYFGPIGMMIGAYSIPILSEISKNKELVNQEINMTVRFIMLLLIPILITTFVFREQIILLLYSSKFIAASNLFFFNVAGDFFKSFAWIFGLWLIPCKKIKAWVLIDLIFNINLIATFYILLYYFHLDLQSITIAYLISNVIHFIINFAFIKRYNNFRLLSNNIKSIIISFIAFILILSVSSFSIKFGYLIILPVISFWAFFAIEKREYLLVFDKIKSFISKNEINGQ